MEAGRRLAEALGAYRGRRPLILAIPRGAVEIGAAVADTLDGELDVVLVRKLRSQFSPELAVGSVDETGWTYVSERAPMIGGTPAHLARERRLQLETLARRRKLYTPAHAPVDPQGRIAIVVDDGIATGATMIAALHAVSARKPARLVCAVPVASAESLDSIRPHADEVVCLATPPDFRAVGQFYRDFPQVDDDTVVKLLRERSAERGRARA